MPVLCFMHRKVKAAAFPLKPFQIYCCFSRKDVFFFFNYSSLWVNLLLLLFLERGFVWKHVLSTEESRTIMGESGAVYLASKVRGHFVLAASSIFEFVRAKITIWFKDVFQSKLSPTAVTIHHSSSSCVIWNCVLTPSFSFLRASIFPAALVYFQPNVKTGW